jgi:hypothetical protein
MSRVLSFATHTFFADLQAASFFPPKQSQIISFWQAHQVVFGMQGL